MPYLIVRGTPPQKGYAILKKLVERWGLPAHVSFAASWIYRITTQDDETLERLRTRLERTTGYEIIAVNAPYDGGAEEERGDER